MAKAISLGFPRIGANRELKKITESFWSGKASREELLATAKMIRQQNWKLQQDAGLDQVPAGDFSFYDQMLDLAWAFDVVPERYTKAGIADDLDLYFTMARGGVTQALEMTKWFDTNYHYLVPEFDGRKSYAFKRKNLIEIYQEAAAHGFNARPVVVGPLTFALLGKVREAGVTHLDIVERLLPAYEELLKGLEAAGAVWVQIDEPALALDLSQAHRDVLSQAIDRLSKATGLKIFLATYFGDLGENLETALRLPISVLHLDLVRGEGQLDVALNAAPEGLTLSLGLIDGRNIWKTDLNRAVDLAEKAAAKLSADRILIGSSCSLLHSPVDLSGETRLNPEVKDWLAFARQKLDEIVVVKRAINEGRDAVRAELDANRESLTRRRNSPLVFNPAVRQRVHAVQEKDLCRQSGYEIRHPAQQAALGLPEIPTTTIGSFPQTGELRIQRARMRKGEITAQEYDGYIRQEIANAIRQQEELGLDVLVHGEAERNDMVEYFGELLSGFAFTSNGWVQSYGSRCVKPPIIYGDVERREPMTVDWWKYAQSLSSKPVKGMLTGPVTILQWSFVRNDQPRRDTCFEIALAIRDETQDLEAAGCQVIQIDEPALREGLPLRKADKEEYLRWAVDAFRLSSAGVNDATQIHTHMCYAEFNEIVSSIAAMDADVISMESARSQMELLDAFIQHRYQNEIGPGVYDIHSPRIPSADEMKELLQKALEVIPKDRLWVNPDCGLKTRRWEEVKPALTNLVSAAQAIRTAI